MRCQSLFFFFIQNNLVLKITNLFIEWKYNVKITLFSLLWSKFSWWWGDTMHTTIYFLVIAKVTPMFKTDMFL